ncbi:MAG: M56 family metallopeptidase [Lawsonibacter sp.]
MIALPLRWLFRRLRLPALACVLLWLVVAVRMLLPVGLVTGPFSVLGWLTPAVQEQTEALARTEEIVLLPAVPDPAPPAAPTPASPSRRRFPPRRRRPRPRRGSRCWTCWRGSGWPGCWRCGGTWPSPGCGCGGGWPPPFGGALRRWAGGGRATASPPPSCSGSLPPCVRSHAGLEGKPCEWVLLHERAHIKLGHHRYKAVYFLLAGLHWFNPMLWLSWVLLGRDLEVACDEKVLGSACGSPREYSAAPLALASPNRGSLLPPASGRRG